MSKGTQRERQCHELYERAGWEAYRPATVRFGENDMFGLFDVLAVGGDSFETHAVQVKANAARGIGEFSEKVENFHKAEWGVYYAVPYDGKGWRLIEIEGPGEWTDVVDERNDDRISSHHSYEMDLGDGVVEYLEGLE